MSRSLALLAALSVLIVLAAGASAPARESSRGCGSAVYKRGYANRIRASGTSCRTARSVARAFQGCRVRHHRGTACRRQLGYRCTTSHRISGYGQFYENARCTKGRRTVTFVDSVDT